ncbi:TetR/AcrR family transcriptional regulator [Cryptosporangium sp. NPDC051539]|uniref:TetR/AcrR family transcriptional regulator n=1 Tax=Cryptosporangium sp. NPDC051539 TaxID=3363962 RepID=UPI0037A11651
MNDTTSLGNRGPGRPTVAATRRQQIVSAFLALVGEKGLATVSLDDIASASGVQRSVMRHYVGNRAQLVRAAAADLVARYTELIRTAVGEEPSAQEAIRYLFSRQWVAANEVEGRAFDELFHEAMRDPDLRLQLRDAYGLLVDELAAAIRRTRPAAPADEIAYQIVCLAEHSSTMQQLGFAPEQAAAAEALALRLIG